MDCDSYIEKYLSAQVDGELSAGEVRRAEEHLARCANCRARFAEERAVKALLRERSRMLRTPVQVRGSILAALDAVDRIERERERARAAVDNRASFPVLRRARVLIPAALAAAAIFAFVIIRGGGRSAGPVPLFDVAIDNYSQFTKDFEPNVPSASPATISDAYLDHEMPGLLWNFEPSGYRIVGGRIDSLPNGSPVAYTLYGGGDGKILCVFAKSYGFYFPPGAAAMHGGHSCYQYKGYSICLSYARADYICMLVSRRSMKQFVRDIVLSEP